MYTEIEMRFLYENDSAVCLSTVDGNKTVFIPKKCINGYVDQSFRRTGLYIFEVLTCVLKKKKLI